MEVIIHESGRTTGLEYGSPEGSAEFVAWVLNRFPPPDDVAIYKKIARSGDRYGQCPAAH